MTCSPAPWSTSGFAVFTLQSHLGRHQHAAVPAPRAAPRGARKCGHCQVHCFRLSWRTSDTCSAPVYQSRRTTACRQTRRRSHITWTRRCPTTTGSSFMALLSSLALTPLLRSARQPVLCSECQSVVGRQYVTFRPEFTAQNDLKCVCLYLHVLHSLPSDAPSYDSQECNLL